MRFQLVVALVVFAACAPAQTGSHPRTAEKVTLGQRPYMGWSSWSFLKGGVTEEKVKAEVDAMFANGLPELGYRYVNLDSGWSDGWDEHGVPKANLTKFPDGMDGFGDICMGAG